MKFSENFQGIFYMSASMAAFVVNDTIVKHAAGDLGLAQTIFVRGVFASILITLFALGSGSVKTLPDSRNAMLIGFRTAAELGATYFFLNALFNMPLANITAIVQSLPLTITLAAALFFGEPLSWRRSVAIVFGAIGVLIIIRPGADGFNIYALFGLGAVACVTYRDLIIRKMPLSISSVFVAAVTAVAVTIAAGIALLIWGGWEPITMYEVWFLALAAVFVLMGYYFSIAAMRFGEVNVVTPFRYTAILWAIFLGWIIFGEVPDTWTFVGMGIILSAGLYTIWRGNRLKDLKVEQSKG